MAREGVALPQIGHAVSAAGGWVPWREFPCFTSAFACCASPVGGGGGSSGSSHLMRHGGGRVLRVVTLHAGGGGGEGEEFKEGPGVRVSPPPPPLSTAVSSAETRPLPSGKSSLWESGALCGGTVAEWGPREPHRIRSNRWRRVL